MLRFQGRNGLGTGLTILAALALAAAGAIAVTVVAVGVFLVLLPVVLIAGLVLYFYLRIKFRKAFKRPPKGPEIIDANYRVVDRGKASEPKD